MATEKQVIEARDAALRILWAAHELLLNFSPGGRPMPTMPPRLENLVDQLLEGFTAPPVLIDGHEVENDSVSCKVLAFRDML